MALPKLPASRGFAPLARRPAVLLRQPSWQYRPLYKIRAYASQSPASQSSPQSSPSAASSASTSQASAKTQSPSFTTTDRSTSASANTSLPPGWEDEPNFNIKSFSELPQGRDFGLNQHMLDINYEFTECLRQMLWNFRAPIRYAFAYGSGVFPQSGGSPGGLSPHPNPPEAIKNWQKNGQKCIDFMFGVTYTQHWHSLNLTQHRDHYSFLGSLGSGVVSAVQDKFGAGVYFNPYITVNGTMIKYGVVNLNTLYRDLSEWDTLYLAGRLQKPVKILRDDARIRLANQVNLISAVRAALLMLGPNFTEGQLFECIAGLSYMGDPRMSVGSENPNKVRNIVSKQLHNFRRLYDPLLETLPNVTHNDPKVKEKNWEATTPAGVEIQMQQDMDPVKRGNMVRRLPKAFREKLYFQYQRQYGISGRDFQSMLDSTKDEDAAGFKKQQGGDFERRIAGERDLKEKVKDAVTQTVKWPSSVQSIKGLFTAGPTGATRYLKEKFEKGREGNEQKSE